MKKATYTILSRRDLLALLAMCDANRNPQQDNRMADTVIVRGEYTTDAHYNSHANEQLHHLTIPFHHYKDGILVTLTLPPRTSAAPEPKAVTRIAMPGRNRIDSSTMFVRPAPAEYVSLSRDEVTLADDIRLATLSAGATL